jgi:hypothetical protein
MDSREIMLVGLGQVGNIKLGRFVTAGTNAPTMELVCRRGDRIIEPVRNRLERERELYS